jgi:hypothetical protein
MMLKQQQDLQQQLIDQQAERENDQHRRLEHQQQAERQPPAPSQPDHHPRHREDARHQLQELQQDQQADKQAQQQQEQKSQQEVRDRQNRENQQVTNDVTPQQSVYELQQQLIHQEQRKFQVMQLLDIHRQQQNPFQFVYQQQPNPQNGLNVWAHPSAQSSFPFSVYQLAYPPAGAPERPAEQPAPNPLSNFQYQQEYPSTVKQEQVHSRNPHLDRINSDVRNSVSNAHEQRQNAPRDDGPKFADSLERYKCDFTAANSIGPQFQTENGGDVKSEPSGNEVVEENWLRSLIGSNPAYNARYRTADGHCPILFMVIFVAFFSSNFYCTC